MDGVCFQESSGQPFELLARTCRCGASRRPFFCGKSSILNLPVDCPLLTACQDLASQIYYWDFYKQECRRNRIPRGHILRPEVGEWMMGFLVQIFLCCIGCCIEYVSLTRGFSQITSLRRQGLPTGWTRPVHGSVNVEHFRDLFPHHGQAQRLRDLQMTNCTVSALTGWHKACDLHV